MLNLPDSDTSSVFVVPVGRWTACTEAPSTLTEPLILEVVSTSAINWKERNFIYKHRRSW